MSATDQNRVSSRLRPAITYTADKVRRQIGKVDNAEVRKARTLARLARTGSIDVLQLGDSLASWVPPTTPTSDRFIECSETHSAPKLPCTPSTAAATTPSFSTTTSACWRVVQRDPL